MKKELLRIENGRLSLNLYETLNGVYLHLLAGEALGIIFANLHEKDALIQVLRGDAFFHTGRMYLDEKTVTGIQAVKQNIHVISRKPSLSDRLSICENLFFTQLPMVMVGMSVYQEMLEDLLDRFHLDIDIHCPLDQLSHGQQVALELMKAHIQKKKTIVLADLTSYLTPDEMNDILHIAAQMKSLGYGFILIESFWDVIFRHTENIAIIKYGKTTGMFRSSELAAEQFRTALWKDLAYQDEITTSVRHFSLPMHEDSALLMRNVSTEVLSEVSLSIQKGQMQKILYLDEASCEHLVALMRGQKQPVQGEILLKGKPYQPRSIKEAQKQGLCIIEDNPQEKMLFPNMSVFDNLAFLLNGRVRGLWINRRYRSSLRRSMYEFCAEDLWDQPLSSLTPGQLQKLIYARYLIFHPALIVCINPFTGMDSQVDSVTERMLNRVLERGTSVLLLASYLPEIKLPGKLLYLEKGRLYDPEKRPE